jgi:hypothetical protein
LARPPILVDDEETWPAELRRAFEDALPELSRYEAVRRELDARAEQDVMLRIRRPTNPHAETTQQAVEVGNRIMSGRNIVGFHCSRLHEDDIADLRANGLRPLATDHLFNRIERRFAAGDISLAVARSLQGQHQAADSNRAGMTWFVFTRPPLRDEFGIWRLLRSWGGEALYGLYESDPVIGPVLRSLGTPSIIKAQVRVEDLRFKDIGEIMRRGFLIRRDIRVDNNGEMEGYVRTTTGPERIMDIYQLGDPTFECLTHFRKWGRKLD